MRVEEYEGKRLRQLQKAFGYTYEEYKNSVRSMALNGSEGIAAMGVDTPLAVLSQKQRPLFDYFKQLFAQVTNPPIDAIREEIVTSTTVYVGKNGNLLEEKAENCQVLKINNPILDQYRYAEDQKHEKTGISGCSSPHHLL
jgi:glutamate synthase (NADPH/NADH) large chain